MRWDRDSTMIDLATLGLALLAAGCAAKQPPQVASPSPPSAASAASALSQQSSTPREPSAKETAQSSGKGVPKADSKPEVSDSGSQAGGVPPDIAPGEALTPDEQRDALDRRLASSLSSFDAMLLKEQKEVAAKRAEQASSGGSSGGAGSGSEGEGGGEGAKGASGATGATGASGSRRDKAEKGSHGTEQASGGDRSTGPSRSGGGAQRGGRSATAPPEGAPGEDAAAAPPKDVGDGRDDDIVARQIREAATKEQDPAIREKLWDEYRRYKGIRKGSEI